MAVIPLTLSKGRAFVTANVLLGARAISPELTFLVDTAAQQTFICQKDEVRLRGYNENLKFRQDVAPVGTMLGKGPVKSLQCDANGLGIAFTDLDKQAVHVKSSQLYFADPTKPVVPSILRKRLIGRLCPRLQFIWDVVGQELKYSILGQDVLNHLALVTIPQSSYGFLTDNREQLRKLMEDGFAPELSRFYESAKVQKAQIEWIH